MRAQQQLYQLADPELAMLICLSCQKEARDVLDQMTIEEMVQKDGRSTFGGSWDSVLNHLIIGVTRDEEHRHHSYERGRASTDPAPRPDHERVSTAVAPGARADNTATANLGVA